MVYENFQIIAGNRRADRIHISKFNEFAALCGQDLKKLESYMLLKKAALVSNIDHFSEVR